MKVQNPIIGRSRGSAGGMTFCKNYDKNVARAKAFEVSNPDTAAQRNQRTFFKQVASVVATVSEEELRSLFGIKPKAMSRRNALSQQVTDAYSVVDGQKVVDFSKLQAIGNGQKVNTQIVHKLSNMSSVELGFPSDFGIFEEKHVNYYAVCFDVTVKAIKIIYLGYQEIFDSQVELDFADDPLEDHEMYLYGTISNSMDEDDGKPFGSFTLKTRFVGKQVEPTPPTLEVTIYSGGTESGNFFHFDGSLFDESIGDQPSLLLNGSTEICDNIQWDAVNNWWFGTTSNDIDTSSPLTLNGTINGESVTGVQVDWVVH